MPDAEILKDSVRMMMNFIGDDSEREGLLGTPDRVLRSWSDLYGGYSMSEEDILSRVFVEGSCDEMVILKKSLLVLLFWLHALIYTPRAIFAIAENSGKYENQFILDDPSLFVVYIAS